MKWIKVLSVEMNSFAQGALEMISWIICHNTNIKPHLFFLLECFGLSSKDIGGLTGDQCT